jgi:hypothetical protein
MSSARSYKMSVALLEYADLSRRIDAPAERDRLARWLQAHPSSVVRIRNNAGPKTPASIFRVRMCFGRGLILFDQPVDVLEGEVLTIVV